MKDVVEALSVVERDGSHLELLRDHLSFGYRCAKLPEGAAVVSARIQLRKDTSEAVSERTRMFLKQKRKSQPLGRWSAGCVFKNPQGDFAGRLIDEAGLKGTTVGDVEVSMIHANFFVNRGQGTAEDFLRLMDKVAECVKQASGVVLEPEVRVMGR
jgi:UDP-N-acetylmuramate dehydrogenase